jgi:hypothetical protein
MTLSPVEIFLTAIPTIVLSLWYVYRSSRINRYDTLALVVAFAYGMMLEVMSIKTVHEYGYANLWLMFGSPPNWVPYSVGLGWASMVYVGMQTSDRVGLRWWQRPFLDGAVATVMDLVLDPGASATRWVTTDSGPCVYQTTPTFGGIGAWTWCVPDNTQGFWYSVPLGNFIGWFVIVATLSFFYRAGRQWFNADGRGWLAQVGLLVVAAALSMLACVLLLQVTSIATRSALLQWTVFGVLIGTPVLLVVAERARLRFDQPVAWGVVVWPLYIYATWMVIFVVKRIDPASWPLAPIGIVATAGFGLVLLFLPNLALLRRRRS